MSERKTSILTVILGVLFVISCKDSDIAGNRDTAVGARTQADTSRADTIRPDTVRPDTIQPDTIQPDTIRPDTTKPDTVPMFREISIEGEEFTVEPSAPDSLNGNGIIFKFTSVRAFPCNRSYFSTELKHTSNGADITLGKLYIPAAGCEGEKKAESTTLIYIP